MRILLVSPAFEAASPSWDVRRNPMMGSRRGWMVPLPLAVVAGMTPEDIQVDLWDETVHGPVEQGALFAEDFDLVGITGYTIHMRRAKAIAQMFRQRGVMVVGGGPGVGAATEDLSDSFDVLFYGEAERTWPRFLAELRSGSHRTTYRDPDPVDLASTPAPRWGRMADHLAGGYLMGAVQVTRGCPFKCEFCNVWKDFGNAMRLKPVDRVIEEVVEMQRLGMERVLFCSDNFVGKMRYAKELLRALVPVNRGFDQPLGFYTELTLNTAKDDELLDLFADAGFAGLLIGVESPNVASLKETRKSHNLFDEVITSCRKIMAHGMAIEASMIVGFDSDTTAIFDEQFEFIQNACFPHPRMHMLKAIPGTDLWDRMLLEGRILDLDEFYDADMSNSGYYANEFISNLVPQGMSRAELFRGYLDLLERLARWDSFEQRVKGFVDLAAEARNRRARDLRNAGPSEAVAAAWKSFVTSLEPEARASVARIIEHTQRLAPCMLPEVGGFIVRQHVATMSLPQIRETMHKQERFESSYDVHRFIMAPKARHLAVLSP